MLKIKRILYPTDFSECSVQAFPHAIYLAEKYHAELHFLHVITVYKDANLDSELNSAVVEEYNKQLEKYADSRSTLLMEEFDIKEAQIIKVHFRGYSPSAVILQYSKEKNIDLIVMGTHGRHGLGYLFLGSVAEEVTRFAKCPVYTIRERKKAKPIEKVNKLLVPLDFSEYSKNALTYAKYISQDYHAELQIIHIVEDRIHPALYATGKSSIFDFMPDIKEKSSKLITEFLQDTPGPNITAQITISEGYAAKEILKFTEKNQIDLIVISTHGRTGLSHFLLGSVAEKIIRRSACPVFTVKSFGKKLYA